MTNPFIKLTVTDVGEQYINVDHIIEIGASSYDNSGAWLMVEGEDSIIFTKETPQEIIKRIENPVEVHYNMHKFRD